jgi:luciferase family oxidoreductase group 1
LLSSYGVVTLYSALDQAPGRAGAPPGAALRESLELARHVDDLGFHRFWVAEHHAMSGVESSSPEVLIGHIASVAKHVRVGSGGVLLPNHRPLHVAEQFRTLAALHPGRIDLGIGRSEGATDEATVLAFGRPQDNAHGAGFEEQLDQLLAFGGVRPLPPGHRLARVQATPAGVPLPPVFLLGSSASSAETAARKGLGYGFAAYSNPDVAPQALRLYRERFVPARAGDRPHAILALKVMVGEDAEHARALALPSHVAHVQHRAGNPSPMMAVEDALAHEWTAAEREAAERIDLRADVTGGIDEVREALAAHVESTQADEVIALTNTYDPAERRASFERLAVAVGLRLPA